MGEILLLLDLVAIVWAAFTLSSLLRAFRAFHEDYRRVHRIDPK